MQAPKNGFFYLVDRETGKVISAEPYAQQNWAERIDLETGRPVEIPEARFADAPYFISPMGIGAHAWHPMSYSPDTGLVYIPVMEVPNSYADDSNFTRRIGRWNTGVSFLAPPEGAVPGATPEARRAYLSSITYGKLTAWDPVKQEVAWEIRRDWPWNGGTLATNGNLVFQGLPDGRFIAYSADKGEELWSWQGERGIMAGPITYRVNGEQYVAVMSGYGGSMGMATQTDWMRRPPPNGVLLVFKIGGTGTIAPLPPLEPKPYVSSDESFTPEQIAEGQAQFFALCTICHNGPVNPNLLKSPAATDANAWSAVVNDGILADRGMISFSPWVDKNQVEAIRAYVLTEAARRAGEEN